MWSILIVVYFGIGFAMAMSMDELHNNGWEFLVRWIFWPLFFTIYFSKAFIVLLKEAWTE